MQTIIYKIQDPAGMHARPAGRLIQGVSGYSSQISLSYGGQEINLKGGIFALLGMGIPPQAEIRLTLNGDSEDEEAQKLLRLLQEVI